MKRRILLIAVVLSACAGAANAQGTWKQLSIPSGSSLQLDFSSPDTGWVAGGSGSYRTTDGGATWSAPTYNNEYYVSDVTFPRSRVGSRNVGYVGIADGGTLVKTTNAGASWTKRALINGIGSVLDVEFLTDSLGYVLGNIGTTRVVRTSNGGTTFTYLTTGDRLLQRLRFFHFDTGFVIGAAGYLAKTTNQGTNWNVLLSKTTNILYDIAFSGRRHGWIVGDKGTILKTVDGGDTWNPQTSGTVQALTSVSFIDTSTGYAVGENGAIVATTNGGTTWTAQSAGTFGSLRKVQFLNASTGYIAGAEGILLKYVPPPASLRAGNRVLTLTGIHANTLSYSVTRAGLVTIRLLGFDGRNVSTLVHETKAPGSYTMTLPSAREGARILQFQSPEGSASRILAP